MKFSYDKAGLQAHVKAVLTGFHLVPALQCHLRPDKEKQPGQNSGKTLPSLRSNSAPKENIPHSTERGLFKRRAEP